MSLRAALSTLSLVLSFGSTALADQGTVRLRNGGVITGEVVMYVPGVRVSVRGPDGQVYTFEAAEVAAVEMEGATPAASAPAPSAASSTGAVAQPSESQPSGVQPAPAPPTPGAGQPYDTTPVEPGATYTPQPGMLMGGRRQELERERERAVNQTKVLPLIVATGALLVVALSGWGMFGRASKNSRSVGAPTAFFGTGCVDYCKWSPGLSAGLGLGAAGTAFAITTGVLAVVRLKNRGRYQRRIEEIDQELESLEGTEPAAPQPLVRLRWDVVADRSGAGLVLRGEF